MGYGGYWCLARAAGSCWRLSAHFQGSWKLFNRDFVLPLETLLSS